MLVKLTELRSPDDISWKVSHFLMQHVDITFVKYDIRLLVGKLASTTQVDTQN